MHTMIRPHGLFLAGLFALAAPSVQADSGVAGFKPAGPNSFGGLVTFSERRGARGHSYIQAGGWFGGLPAGKNVVRLQRSCATKLPADVKDVYVLGAGEPDAKGKMNVGANLEGIPMGGGRGERGVIGMSVLVLNVAGNPVGCATVVKFKR